jgi:DNA-binding CsgD family transcriptional regulator
VSLAPLEPCGITSCPRISGVTRGRVGRSPGASSLPSIGGEARGRARPASPSKLLPSLGACRTGQRHALVRQLAVQFLIAADVFHASIEDRPHRRPLTFADAAPTVSGLGIDAAAVRAVLEVHGQALPRREEHAAGLSDREVEVLRLLARGLTKREVGLSLHVSPATIHTPTMHIYDKIRARSRAALALFGMEHGLLSSDRIEPMRTRGRAH